MNKENLKVILKNLKEIVSELETQLDTGTFHLDIPYEEVLEYYKTNTDGGID